MKKPCKTKYCRNNTTSNYCSTCRSRKSRSSDPLRYSYTTLKNNSKRRGKVFQLTIEEFNKFCIKYNYLRGKGKTSESYSIDCIENDKGYVKDNIRVLPLADNSRKGTKILHFDWRIKYAVVTTHRIIEDDDNPF